MRAAIVALGTAACLAVTAPAAQAWVRTAHAAGDPQTTWIVTARTITIRSTDPALLSFVRGSHVLLGCDASPQVPTNHPSPAVLWGPTASSITARVENRIGRDLFECDAVDVGRVPGFPDATRFSHSAFDSRFRKLSAGTPPPGRLLVHDQLSEYWGVVQSVLGPGFLNRYGIVVRLPPARDLVRKLSRHSGVGVRYTRSLAGVAVPRVVYVIGAGTSRKKLEMAVIGFDGKLYTLHTTVGANSHPTFGTG